jgi:hypothetical protein
MGQFMFPAPAELYCTNYFDTYLIIIYTLLDKKVGIPLVGTSCMLSAIHTYQPKSKMKEVS